jgi:hypothetical protein
MPSISIQQINPGLAELKAYNIQMQKTGAWA